MVVVENKTLGKFDHGLGSTQKAHLYGGGGTLALTLHMSRLIGVAPIRMTRARIGWHIAMSTAFIWYSYVLIIALDIFLLLGLFMDLSSSETHSIRVRTLASRWAWYLDLGIIMLISNYGVFTAPKRMKIIFKCINLLDTIHKQFADFKNETPMEIKNMCIIIFQMVSAFVSYFGDFWSFYKDAFLHNKDTRVALLYVCFYIEAFLAFMLSLQFVVIGYLVEAALKTINLEIMQIIENHDLKAADQYHLIRGTCFATAIPVPLTQPPISKIIVSRYREQSSKEPDIKIHSLAYAYAITCNMLTIIDGSFGVITVLSVGSVFYHLMVTPYYLASFMLSKNPDRVHSMFELGTFIYNLLHLILLTEPGNRIKIQTVRLSMLLSQVLRRITSEDHRFKELEYFYEQVMMYQPAFTALGIGNMRRPLILAVLAGICNYLTIVIQMEVTDINNW